MSVRPATAEHEAFYQEAAARLKSLCKKYKSVRNMEIIAVLSRMLGYCIAMCYPAERDLARKTAIANIDQAVSDVASNAVESPFAKSSH